MAHVEGSGTGVIAGPVNKVMGPEEKPPAVAFKSRLKTVKVATSSRAKSGGLPGGKTEFKAVGLVPCSCKVMVKVCSDINPLNTRLSRVALLSTVIVPLEASGSLSHMAGSPFRWMLVIVASFQSACVPSGLTVPIGVVVKVIVPLKAVPG